MRNFIRQHFTGKNASAYGPSLVVVTSIGVAVYRDMGSAVSKALYLAAVAVWLLAQANIIDMQRSKVKHLRRVAGAYSAGRYSPYRSVDCMACNGSGLFLNILNDAHAKCTICDGVGVIPAEVQR